MYPLHGGPLRIDIDVDRHPTAVGLNSQLAVAHAFQGNNGFRASFAHQPGLATHHREQSRTVDHATASRTDC